MTSESYISVVSQDTLKEFHSMAKKNTKRKLVGLVSELTGHRTYYTTKNTQNTTEKIVLKKYDPIARKHATYTETKKNLGRNEVKKRKN